MPTDYPPIRPSLLLDFANTKTLDPRITYTRASAGTYYDGKTVAKAEENLLTRSQEFDNSNWVKNASSVTANSVAAPDGTTTAETITENSASDVHVAYQDSALALTTVYTLSVFLKANTRNFGMLRVGGGGVATGPAIKVDLTNGTVTVIAGIVISSSATSVGNGWYRCTLSFTSGSSAGHTPQVGTHDNSSNPIYTGNGTGSVYIWGAQLEQRSTVTAYTATTTAPITNYIPVLLSAPANVARFEHNPVTGESLGLEIEEQRTNLFTYSDDFSNAVWAKNNVLLTANTIIAPDGTLTADKVILAPGTFQKRINIASGTFNANTYTMSCYAKAGEYGFLTLSLFDTTYKGAVFNLTTGALGTVSGSTAVITSVGNGWYRCAITVTTTTTLNVNPSGFWVTSTDLGVSGLATSVGDNFSGLYIWGAQLEAGAFATSYIPTTVSQVTRSADSASMTGTNFSSWYRADEGTLYAEGIGSVTSTANATLINICDSGEGQTERNQLRLRSVGASYVYSANAVAQASITNGAYVATGNKVASVYKVNDFAVSNNSTAVGTDTLGSVGSPVEARFGRLGIIEYLNGTIKKIAYYPKRLTNAEIQSLTVI